MNQVANPYQVPVAGSHQHRDQWRLLRVTARSFGVLLFLYSLLVLGGALLLYHASEYPAGQFERRLGVTWESSRDMATHAALTDAYRNEGRMWSTGLAVGGAFALVSGVALWALGRPIISQSPPDYRP